MSTLTSHKHWLGGYVGRWDNDVFTIDYVAPNVWAIRKNTACRGRTPRLAAEAYVLHVYGVRP